MKLILATRRSERKAGSIKKNGEDTKSELLPAYDVSSRLPYRVITVFPSMVFESPSVCIYNIPGIGGCR